MSIQSAADPASTAHGNTTVKLFIPRAAFGYRGSRCDAERRSLFFFSFFFFFVFSISYSCELFISSAIS